jgi:Putative auto-transporter adhesin, head GIN domain
MTRYALVLLGSRRDRRKRSQPRDEHLGFESAQSVECALAIAKETHGPGSSIALVRYPQAVNRAWRRCRSRRMGLSFVSSALASIVFVATSCNSTRITGSGSVVRRPFRLDGFTRLDVQDAFNVSVRRGETDSVVLRVDDNLVDRLDVRVTSGELHIGLRPRTSTRHATLEAEVTMRSLTAIAAGGASEVTLPDVTDSEHLEVKLSGASRLEGGFAAGTATFGLSGSSDAEIHGTGTTVTVEARGASQLSMDEFQIGSLSVSLSGASQASVSVTDTIAADLSGASILTYRGDPTFTRRKTSGTSVIEPA